jgi:recombination protein RecA
MSTKDEQRFVNANFKADEAYWIYAKSGEEIYEDIMYLVEKENVKLIVMDSIPSVQPTITYTNDVADKHMGQHASLHKAGILKIQPLLQAHQAILIGINQRTKPISHVPVGSEAKGGQTWRFQSWGTFILKKNGSNRSLEGKDHVPLNIFIDKNNGGTSYETIETFFKQGYGIDKSAELAVVAEQLGLIKKAGSWWKTADGESIGQGDPVRFEWALANQDLILSQFKPKVGTDND